MKHLRTEITETELEPKEGGDSCKLRTPCLTQEGCPKGREVVIKQEPLCLRHIYSLDQPISVTQCVDSQKGLSGTKSI